MLNQIGSIAAGIRNHLTKLDDQPIGGAALSVVVLLDIFILVSIFNGLADHTRQLTSPVQYVPTHCREIVIQANWSETDQLLRVARLVTQFRERSLPEKHRPYTYHPICERLTTPLDTIKKNSELAKRLKELQQITVQLRQTRSRLDRVRGAYDVRASDGSAVSDDEVGGATVVQPAIQKEVLEASNAIEILVEEQAVLRDSLNGESQLQQVFELIATVSDEDREQLATEVRTLNFWYPVKRLGMEMMFLLPLVAVFYFWNARSIAAARPLQVLVSSHLLVVVAIPVLAKLAELVYDILPKKLLLQIFEILESLNLIAIWHYVVMALAIVAALLLVYLFQKKLFSHERLLQKRIAQGMCQQCGARLAPGGSACTLCGFQQYRECTHCHEPTFKFGEYCRNCGEP
jgi:hypothetical protein